MVLFSIWIPLVRAQSSQLFSTVSFTLFVYSLRLSLYRFDASTFAGELVFGSFSKLDLVSQFLQGPLPLPVPARRPLSVQRRRTNLCTLVKIAATSYVGLHRFCNISKHSSPLAYTFGWNIVLINLTPGGLLGYCSSNCITRRNVPSSKGVSAGPMITAFLYVFGQRR